MNDAAQRLAARWNWFDFLPATLVVGWWLFDLQFQWRSLVDYQYGWIVALLVGYLVWERWPAAPGDDSPARTWLCTGIAAAGAPLVLGAELYKQAIARSPAASFLLSIGCVLFLTANLLYSRGPKTWRHFLFPMLFMFLAVPLPGMLWNPIILGLQRFVTAVDVELLNLLGIPALQRANVIQLPHCVVGVNEACSGIRSLQSSMMAALFVGNLVLRRFKSQLVFLALGVGLAIFANCLRAFLLSLIAHRYGIETLDRFHDAAGWSIFLFTTFGLIVAAWLIIRLEGGLIRSASRRNGRDHQPKPSGTAGVLPL